VDRSASILQSSRRESRFVAVLWVASCAWTVGYYALHGFGRRAAAQLVWGLPAWVLWGIVAPWMVCLAATVWFSLWGMRDEDLGQDQAPPGTPREDEASRGTAARG
jgi:hypothetical protein